MVKRGFADAELVGDILQRGRVVTVLPEGLQRRMQDLGPAPLAFVADMSRDGRTRWILGHRPLRGWYLNVE